MLAQTRQTPSLFFMGVYLLTLPVYGLLRLADQAQALSAMTVIIIVLFFCASMAHLIETRRWWRAVLMAGSAFILTIGAEMFGVATGLLFGNYSYTEQLGPLVLGLVPLAIPVAWLMMLYPSYAIAGFLLSPRSNDFSRYLRAALAALAMTAWDLSLDPRMVRDGNWVWHDGGPYFGIPLSNFIGWFITALAIYLVWQVIDRRRVDTAPHPSASRTHTLWLLLPIYAYIIQWVAESMANIVFWGSPLVGVAVFIGMGVFSVPALIQLRQRASRITASS
jgi:putative membrane protein